MKEILIFFLLFISIPSVYGQNAIDSLFLELNHATSDKNKGIIYNKIARAYQGSDLDKSLEFADSALQVANAIGYQEGIANAYRNFGDISSDRGKYHEARDFYQLSLQISKAIKSPPLIVRSLNGLGISYSKLGDYERALSYYKKGLKLAEEIGDREMEAGIINNLGMIFFDLENYQKSIESFQNALSVNKELGEKKKVAIILCNLANVQSKMGNTEQAIANYKRSLVMAKEMGHHWLRGTILTNIGLLQFRKDDLKSASKSYKSVMEIAEEMGDKLGIAILLTNLGGIDRKNENYEDAVDKYLRSLEITLNIGAKEHESSAYRGLAKSYAAMQSYKEAYKYHKLWKELEDSLSSQESKKEIAALYAKYQSKKKEQQNQLLRERQIRDRAIIQRQYIIGISIGVVLVLVAIIAFIFYKAYKQKQKANFILKQKKNEIEEKNKKLILLNEEISRQNKDNLKQKSELEKLNYIKDKLLSIISHDLRSPLNSLQGTLKLLSAKVLTNEEVHKISGDLVDKVGHASSLCDNLLNWAKSQLKGITVHIEAIDLKAMTKENIDLLQPMADKKGVVLVNHISAPLNACADKNMIKLVIRNLMSNAIKFSAKGDTVAVNASQMEDFVEVMIKDTGIGISAEDKTKLFNLETYTTQGTALETGTGLGLILCHDFIKKNGGDISFTSTKGEGSVFKFSLPVN